MYVCAIVRFRLCDVRGKLTHLVSNEPDTHCACRLCMRSDPPITLVLILCAEADRRLGAKKKSNVSYLELFQLQEGYWPNMCSVPQLEVTQLICLTMYVGTTQQSPAWVLFCKWHSALEPTRCRLIPTSTRRKTRWTQVLKMKVSQRGELEFWERASAHEWAHMKYKCLSFWNAGIFL